MNHRTQSQLGGKLIVVTQQLFVLLGISIFDILKVF